MTRKVETLSIVVPCHNEEEVLPETQARLHRVMGELVSAGSCQNFEVVYVDNGSTDRTLQTIEELKHRYPSVRGVSLTCNFGYQGSISAGLAHARGDVVVSIDADLQDPPEKIGEMIAHYEKGCDLVLGVREDRSSDSFLKKLFSQFYYRLLHMMGVDIVYNHGDFRLMSRSLVDTFNRLSERNRFIRAMVLQLDSSFKTVGYKRIARARGRSKFNLGSLISLSFDGIVSFSYMPLHLVFLSGLAICLACIIAVFWVLYLKLSGEILPGWTSTVLPILSLGGFQLFALGLIGEYVGRLYIEIKQRPLFIVRKEL